VKKKLRSEKVGKEPAIGIRQADRGQFVDGPALVVRDLAGIVPEHGGQLAYSAAFFAWLASLAAFSSRASPAPVRKIAPVAREAAQALRRETGKAGEERTAGALGA
jgi:hypothetical protein